MGLQLISGDARGLNLSLPPDARPSSARLREALLSMLLHNQDLRGDYPVILDLFAGSGAVGLEFLSSFAQKGFFVESHDENIQSLRRNLEKFTTRHPDKVAESIHHDVHHLRHLPDLPQLIFADPPYAMAIEPLCQNFRRQDFFKQCRLFILQTAPDVSAADVFAGLSPITKRYGNANLHFFIRDVKPS